MKCANCSADALFEYQLTPEASIFYCGKHLPKFLEPRKRAGLLKITDKFIKAKKEMEEVLANSIPASEEPVLEINRAIHGSTMRETAPEVMETSKPKKKAAKKKAE